MSKSLLVDEHFPPRLPELLRGARYDVVGVAETPALQGAPDDMVFQAGTDWGRPTGANQPGSRKTNGVPRAA